MTAQAAKSPEQHAREANAQVDKFFRQSDPLRVRLAELLRRVEYLLVCEKVVACWREKGLPF
jgi:hypothetical protein